MTSGRLRARRFPGIAREVTQRWLPPGETHHLTGFRFGPDRPWYSRAMDTEAQLIADLVEIYGPGSGDPAVQLVIDTLNDPNQQMPDDCVRAIAMRAEYVRQLQRIRESRTC